MRLLLIFALLAACCAVAVGQKIAAPAAVTPPTTGGPSIPPSLAERMGRDPAFPMRVTGTILAVDKTRGLLMIELADKSRPTFVVDSKFRARADKDTALAGRKDLSLSDYKPGQLVRVVYRAEDSRALEIRLKRSKAD